MNLVIENWSVVLKSSDVFPQVLGMIVGHPFIPDGLMLTSLIQLVDESTSTVHTRNSIYTLGEKNLLFDRWLKKNGGNCEKGFRYQVSETIEGAPNVPRLDEIYCGPILSTIELANNWLTPEDWCELHPGVPMSWLNDEQHLQYQRNVSARTVFRMREADKVFLEKMQE